MLADNMTAKIPILIRTYRGPANQTDDCEVWKAARATTATPNYFEPITIGSPGTSLRCIDGGFGQNNPVRQVYEESKAIFPGRSVSCLISIGCGQASTIHIPKPGIFQRAGIFPNHIIQAAKDMATDCEEKHQETARSFTDGPGIYFRFNVDRGLDMVGFEEWKKFHNISSHTKHYMMMQETNQMLDSAMHALRDIHHANVVNDSGEGLVTPLYQSKNHIWSVGPTIEPTSKRPRRFKTCPAPSRYFTGREDELRQMANYFDNDKLEQHIFVLHGLGGGGKTQTALKFVDRCQHEKLHLPSRWVPLPLESLQCLHIAIGFLKYFSPMRAPRALSKPTSQTLLSSRTRAAHTRIHWIGFVILKRNGCWCSTMQMTLISIYNTTSRRVLMGILSSPPEM